MGEKTEKATPKKLRDARKKGQVAKSQDFPSAFTFIVSLSAVLGLSTYLYTSLTEFIKGVFSLVPRENLETLLPSLYYQGIVTIFLVSIPIMMLVAFVGVAVNFLSVGPVFSLEVFKFDIKKFDPIKNLKAKFKLKTLVELLKSLLKVGVAAYIIYDVMYNSLPVLVKTVNMPMSGAILVLYAFIFEVVIKVGLFFIIVAVLDFAYQRRNFANEMKMEKFEIKQEYKNTEGDPQIKSKRRQIAQEIAYSDSPVSGVNRAKAVVTNPTHLAIAIGYERELDAAPYIAAKGKDLIAQRIVKLAEQNGIPIIRNIKLAHRLYDEGELYEYVPEDTYEVLAKILRWVEALGTESENEYLGPTDFSE